MSVPVSKRSESKFEVIIQSITVHEMLTDLMQRHFGIKSHDQVSRHLYRSCKNSIEEYEYLIDGFKKRIDFMASLMTSNVRAANSIYPTSQAELEKRRSYQNMAIINCEQIIKELQRIVNEFDVDVNIYKQYVDAIYKEETLIKKWRQQDNKRSY